MTEPEVVCDAGPLIHLDELSCLDLLGDYAHVWIAEPVAREVSRHRPSALSDPPFAATVVHASMLFSDPRLSALSRAFSLDAGEVAAFQLLEQHHGALFLTDDSAARLAAKAIGVRSYGTLGILIRAVRRGRRSRSEVVDLLRSIPGRSTLFLSRDVLDDAIRQVAALE